MGRTRRACTVVKQMTYFTFVKKIYIMASETQEAVAEEPFVRQPSPSSV